MCSISNSVSLLSPRYRQNLTMRLDGSDFYCLFRDNASELLRFENMTLKHRQAHKMRSMGYYDYVVSGDMQALSKLNARYPYQSLVSINLINVIKIINKKQK
ncbi:hypothetical protein A3Q34_09770 [Colwellia sp. PAMC 20917]|uniref:hypothetical protein n=1 Tax=Colwellia sp. PAMC 20917 TaxID=1816218 RepID=UPI000878341E|nr:hypothetical protein [Colwellia sp. PAMC 20917]AOW77118.1 hypothetical protein A3Q34_09770 [Colwellia sp. PAMC 20917]